MKGNDDTYVLMMANEKLITMLSLMEQTLEFLNEYKVKPDDEVRKEFVPLLQKWEKWIEAK